MKIFYYTSTGNSLYVAKEIKDKLPECQLISMTAALKDKNFDYSNEEAIGLIYPIHCGSLPIVAWDFISKLKVNKNTYLFTIGVTGGGGAELSFYHINKLLKEQCEISNYTTLRYISNYIRAGRNPSEERILKAIEDNKPKLDLFIEDIKFKKVNKKKFKAGLMNLGYKGWKNLYKNKDKGFNVNDSCTSCNICSKVCPVNNILMVAGKPTWKGNCTDCLGCINICPKSAINIGTKTIEKNRFRNPGIEVKELL